MYQQSMWVAVPIAPEAQLQVLQAGPAMAWLDRLSSVLQMQLLCGIVSAAVALRLKHCVSHEAVGSNSYCPCKACQMKWQPQVRKLQCTPWHSCSP
jgi:hypothetical protein